MNNHYIPRMARLSVKYLRVTIDTRLTFGERYSFPVQGHGRCIRRLYLRITVSFILYRAGASTDAIQYEIYRRCIIPMQRRYVLLQIAQSLD